MGSRKRDYGIVTGLCCLVTFLVSVPLVIFGALAVGSCPKEEMVPVYMIVAGSLFLAIFVLLVVWFFCVCSINLCVNSMGKERHVADQIIFVPTCCYAICYFILVLTMFAWHFIGTAYVVGAFKPEFSDPKSEEYCDKISYYFALVVLASGTAALFLCPLCVCVCFKIKMNAVGRTGLKEVVPMTTTRATTATSRATTATALAAATAATAAATASTGVAASSSSAANSNTQGVVGGETPETHM